MATDPSQFGSGADNSGSGSGAVNDPTTNPTKVVVNGGGAGNPGDTAAFQPPAGHPNPFIDPRPFRIVTIGGIQLPGVIETPEGCGTPEDWSKQKGTGSNFDTSVWKGSKTAEKMKIKMNLYDADGFDRIYIVRDTLRPKRGVKPPTHKIENPIINFGGIIYITIEDIGFPKWEKSGNYWTYEIEVSENNPSSAANTGPSDPSKPADGSTPDGAAKAKTDYVLGAVKDA